MTYECLCINIIHIINLLVSNLLTKEKKKNLPKIHTIIKYAIHKSMSNNTLHIYIGYATIDYT